MSNQRGQINMTDAEVEAFLQEPHKLQLATINPDGTPHLVTMYYDVFDGRIGFWSYGKSQKMVNLRRDPRLTCLVESGANYGELRGVQVVGKAELVEDVDAVREIGRRVYGRYVPGELNEGMQRMIDHQAQRRHAVLVTPTSTTTWDHTKLG